MIRRTSQSLVIFAAACLWLGGTMVFAADPPAAGGAAQSVDQLLEYVRSYQLGKDRRPLEQLEEMATQSVRQPERRKDIAQKLAALLPSEMTFEGKDFILRTLYVMGTPAEIPAVGALLTDDKYSHMARYVLESMGTPEAAAAMREAMPHTKGRTLIGIVHSLGNLRDAESISPLAGLLNSADGQAAIAAAGALGRIGTSDAATVLNGFNAPSQSKLNQAVADAMIRCADLMLAEGKAREAIGIYETYHRSEDAPPQVRIAAARGLVKARGEAAVPLVVQMLKSDERQTMVMGGGLARQLKGGNSTKALANALPSLKPEAQEVLAAALADRGDAAAKPPIVALVSSPEVSVRVAALRALASLGDGADVPMLLDKAARGQNREREAARLALSRIRGNDVNAAVMRAVSAGAAAGDDFEAMARGIEGIKALASRAASEHVTTLVKLAKSNQSEPIRTASITALGTLVEQKDYPALIDILANAQSDAERNEAKSALGTAAVRLGTMDPSAEAIAAAAKDAQPAAKAQLLEALSRVGGGKALEAIRTALKDPDAAVSDAAARALGQWRDDSVVADLLRLMESNKPNHKIFALRGLSRLLANPENRRTADQMLEICRRMMRAADRPDEKRLVLGRIGDIKDARALDMATRYLADANLRNEAATAVVNISQSIKKQVDAAKEALQKVQETPEINESVKTQAKEMFK